MASLKHLTCRKVSFVCALDFHWSRSSVTLALILFTCVPCVTCWVNGVQRVNTFPSEASSRNLSLSLDVLSRVRSEPLVILPFNSGNSSVTSVSHHHNNNRSDRNCTRDTNGSSESSSGHCSSSSNNNNNLQASQRSSSSSSINVSSELQEQAGSSESAHGRVNYLTENGSGHLAAGHSRHNHFNFHHPQRHSSLHYSRRFDSKSLTRHKRQDAGAAGAGGGTGLDDESNGLTSLTCEFGTFGALDLCSWRVPDDSHAHVRWKTGTGSSAYWLGGPLVDKTTAENTGTYYYINTLGYFNIVLASLHSHLSLSLSFSPNVVSRLLLTLPCSQESLSASDNSENK